jgi:hypothetical protein
MTLNEAVAIFERELPEWWWTVGQCKVSAHASAAPDYRVSDDQIASDKRFDRGFHEDLKHTSQTFTPADALLAVLKAAKAALEEYQKELAA